MLQSIRDNSQGIIAKIIVGLIAVTFALFGVESLVSLTAGSNAPATVNGEEISQQDLVQGVQLQKRQMLSQMGEDADPALLDDNLISNMVLEGLIEQTVLVQSASDQGLTFSDNMIDQLILTTTDFQQDGQFNRAQFEAVLRNAGLTPMMYRDLIRKDKITEQERAAFMLSAFTLPSELTSIAQLDSQTRDLRYFTLPASSLRSSLNVSDQEIADYYDEHRSEYLTDEQVAIEYLLLERSALETEITVTDEQLESAYQLLIDTFQAQELRHSAHILVAISDEQDDAAAKAKAANIAERIAAGEAFEAIAKTESDDPASAEMGGDLGVNEKGVFSDEFDNALFALEKGQVSSPVRTEFGYHIIKLIDIEATEVPSFEKAKADLASDLLNQLSEEEYVAQLERLADISFSSGDLVEPSEVLDLEIQKTELFSRTGSEDEITANPKVLGVAFDEELIKDGLNSTPIELDSGRALVLRVVQHELPREKTLEEVAAMIKEALLDEKVAQALAAQADELIAKLKQGDSLENVATGATVTTLAGVTRTQQDLPQELRSAVFKLPKPAENAMSYAAVDMLDGSKSIVVLDKVTEADVDLKPEEISYMSMMLSNRKGQQDYQDYLTQLKEKAEVERL
ncbi:MULTISPECIES: SurA N-terminal domain-containing protein [unclassified Neptuniibacter]|uniref:SurA N-terminal domain-containing protein n=1 Tax=unclassified Neptuniibacter TaxID=2630693 RepID=UPI0026E46AC2|nr:MULTISPECIES: SurA N-terminal domain-containing protein [unclassified Neptuniibacter]MDO6515150.1 SurA N-terminal domain-containing protein [Neptuniibacter sp. 2_MG-2023]MDO6592262.1 SurA N-terminal domain-containing protein [Neptuniibacter sp. 1_MG-2023]